MLIESQLTKIKLALQLKYLLANPLQDLYHQSIQQNQQKILIILNSFQPFSTYPLDTVPPVDLVHSDQILLLQENLASQLDNYIIVVLTGSVKIKNGSFQYTVRDFLNQQTSSRIQFPINGSKLQVNANTFVLKIHKFWYDEAVKNKQKKKVDYCRLKLLKNPFFTTFNYTDFKYICMKSKIIQLNSDEMLIDENQIPQNLYYVLEGQLIAEKNILFRRDKQLMFEFAEQIQNIQPHIQPLLPQITRNPSQQQILNKQYFTKSFIIKQFGQTQILCMKQLLHQLPLKCRISSQLKAKLLVLNRSQFYKISKQKISQLKVSQTPQTITIDQVAMRKKYFKQIPWKQFKEFLRKQNKFLKQTRQRSFDAWLRSGLNLNTKRYNFTKDQSIYHYNQSIRKDALVFNPIQKIHKVDKALDPNHNKDAFLQI